MTFWQKQKYGDSKMFISSRDLGGSGGGRKKRQSIEDLKAVKIFYRILYPNP